MPGSSAVQRTPRLRMPISCCRELFVWRHRRLTTARGAL